ncbi:Calx-beta domain-containing protein [uncultured Campylobacter sp.]|uniref:Calx-beta domain-containing protein n=1 Tax=uncultured Campylobacter sp. TaxID=218934 RepID=UPI00262A46B7|nr:Calx-beta domain-containing protein [uncultured Campylobacter sp.]
MASINPSVGLDIIKDILNTPAVGSYVGSGSTLYDAVKNAEKYFDENNGSKSNAEKAVIDITSFFTGLKVKGAGLATLPASFDLDVKTMQDDIKKYGSVRPSSMAATAADALLAIGVLPTPLGVGCAIGGMILTLIAWKLDRMETYEDYKQKVREAQFLEYAKYLHSDEVQTYLQDPNKVNLTVSNLRIIENDGEAIFTVSIDKALEKDLNLRLFTVEGSALEEKDYGRIGEEKKNYIFAKISAGVTSITQKVKIVRDGKTEGKEVFLLVAESLYYSGYDVENVTKFAAGLGTIIDFPEDKCPQPTHKNFDLSFNLPSSTSYGEGGGFGGGGGGGAGGGASWSIGSVPSISIPSKQPSPDIPYVECPDEPEFNSMLIAKIPQAANNTAPANSNPLNSQAANENDNSGSCSDGMCVPNRSEQNSGSGDKDKNKAGFASNANNANSKQSGAALNLSGTTDTDKSGNKLYFDMNSDGFKERMLDWFGQDEGVLVNDTNRNGIVDNGSEIIGNRYLNSKGETTLDTLSLLRDFDTNKDGVIDSKDNSGLSIWIDKNRNAKTDEGELISYKRRQLADQIDISKLSGYSS